MRQLELALAALMTLASSFALGAESAPSAEDVVSRLTGEDTVEQRETWFNSNAKGKLVAWVAPVFNVTPAFDVVLVNVKVSDRGLIGCNVTDRFKKEGKRSVSRRSCALRGPHRRVRAAHGCRDRERYR